MDGHHVHSNVSFVLDGRAVTAEARPGLRLSEALREQLGARDVKIGCNAGDCGACSVMLGGEVVCACLVTLQQAEGMTVDTLAGLRQCDPTVQRLEQSFQDHGAAQCGICTPGMMVSALALLRENQSPSETEIEDALGGVLCRCTGYRKIIDAVGNVPGAVELDGAVGTALRKLDGAAKVAGSEAFGDDVAPVGTLEILLIRSPYPRARFRFEGLDAWTAAMPGIEAVLTAGDIPGKNCFGVIPAFADQPVFAETVARFKGEAVAAVIAAPEVIRGLDPDSFPVEWTELTPVETCQAAQAEDAPLVHEGRVGNVMCGGLVTCGDPEAALATADVVVEASYRTGFVEHAYIEPEAGFAEMVGDRVEVHACTQAPVMDLEALEDILAMDRSRIRVIPTAVGGGFGAKLDITMQPYLALGALKTGKPVRICYSRAESMQSSTKRHPSEITLKIGAMQDGRICGFDFYGAFNTGAYASWGPTVATRVPVHASGPYKIADYRAQSEGIHTNCPPAGAFRGFGVPQAAIAQETLFDLLAEKLGLDALEFRISNALDDGMTTVCGQVFDQGVGAKACLQALRDAWRRETAESAGFNDAQDGPARRGVGIAAGWYGCGNTSLPNPSTIRAGLRADGTVVLHQGAMDIGQGANTVIPQIFATALGVPVAALSLQGADTDITPDAGKTSASRQTFVSGNAARLCGAALRRLILRRANAPEHAVLCFGDGVVTITDDGQSHVIDLSTLPPGDLGYVLEASETYDPPTKPLDQNGQGAPYAQFGYAAQLAVVEVDIALGTVRPIKFVAAHDVGKAINPLLVEGQVHGGITQGLGMALMEEYLPGRTENLHDYLIPTIGDVPPIETLILEVPDAHGPYGAKGLGEHVLIPTAPALVSAIYRATGVWVRDMPVTPSKLRRAIKEAQNG
ncbi:MAG: molybdopterin cofactor-binding domain-containing protein [Pseudomonadota bacterium]